MIPQPQGYALVVEPVDRERIEQLQKEEEAQKAQAGFVSKADKIKETPVKLRVVAAGPGIQYQLGFIPNHIQVGDIILGTISENGIARDFNDLKSHWEFDGKKYLVINSRDSGMDITGATLFIVERANG